jgi:cystathionine beta-lyase
MSGQYDFDTPVERRGTSSLKWDYGERLAGRADLLPLWVADMDFRVAPQIQHAIADRAAHGVFGYTLEPESYFEAAALWLERRHAWPVRRQWILASPGVMPSLSAAILAFSSRGDRVVVQPPVYHLFHRRVVANGREVVENPLVLSGDRYVMDLEHLERVIDERTRMLILCSPHNPVGRVWSPEELEALVQVCAPRRIVIVSDEIHHDIVMPGFRHMPLARVSEEAAAIAVTLTSVTKSFNLAGLGGSLAIVPDEGLRSRLREVQGALLAGGANPLAIAAAEAAWRLGEGWIEELVAYLASNHTLLCERIRDGVPGSRVLPMEGTYLAWMDARELGLTDDEITRRLRDTGGVWLDEGRKFGRGGGGFQRINLACPRATLLEATDGIARALGVP